MKIIKLNKKIITLNLVIIIICTLSLAVRPAKTRLTLANVTGKYHILVDVEESKMYILQDGVCIKTYACSGGKYSTPSPIRHMDNYRKSNMGRRLWWQMDGI